MHVGLCRGCGVRRLLAARHAVLHGVHRTVGPGLGSGVLLLSCWGPQLCCALHGQLAASLRLCWVLSCCWGVYPSVCLSGWLAA